MSTFTNSEKWSDTLVQSKSELESKQYADQVLSNDLAGSRKNYYFFKRIIDLVLSVTVLILLSPILILISLAILVYSPGPVFFVQERVGARRRFENGKYYWKKENFKIYKFRTMKVNSDSSIHQAYVKALIKNDREKMDTIQGEKTETRKLIHDPRITRPGALLRKLSLDELPQLWNVIRGEMSLVGPRPALSYEVEVYQPWHCQRFATQPGITGLQQVEARCTADFDEQVHWDIKYIENQSLWLDLKIILKTPFIVISTKGAN